MTDGRVRENRETGSDRNGVGGATLPDDLARLESLGAADAVRECSPTNEAQGLDLANPVSFPGPISEAYYWDDADVVGIQGPVGSGKTTTKMRRKIRRAVMMPRSTKDGVRRYKVLFIRQTYRQLWSTTIPSYLETFPKAWGEWSGGRGDPVTHRITFEDAHGPIEFTAEFMAFGDDIIASMRGVQTTDIDLNEADTMPVEILTVGIGRIDRWPGREHLAGYAPELRSYGQIDCDFNAPDEENWTYRVFHDAKERDRMAAALSADLPKGAKAIRIAFHNQPGFGQPGCENLQNLSPSYYPRQIASMRLAGRGDMIERLVYNKPVYMRVGEPVFAREWNRRVHVSDDLLEPWPDLPLLIGLDQGFKGAAVVCQFKSPFHWRVLREFHWPRERLMAKTFGERLADGIEADPRLRGRQIEAGYADMAGEHGASQAADENMTWNLVVGRAAGFRIFPQRIGTNRIQPRLEALRAALEFMHGGEPGLAICGASCRLLIAGFEARYVWTDQVDASGDKRKVPDKRYTEANVMDALQYVALSQVKPDGTSPITGGLPRQSPSDRRIGAPATQPRGLSGGYDLLNPY